MIAIRLDYDAQWDAWLANLSDGENFATVNLDLTEEQRTKLSAASQRIKAAQKETAP